MYYMRHTRDYETLELPVGASRADVKAAYRKLAKVHGQTLYPHVKGHSDSRKNAMQPGSFTHSSPVHQRVGLLANNRVS